MWSKYDRQDDLQKEIFISLQGFTVTFSILEQTFWRALGAVKMTSSYEIAIFSSHFYLYLLIILKLAWGTSCLKIVHVLHSQYHPRCALRKQRCCLANLDNFKRFSCRKLSLVRRKGGEKEENQVLPAAASEQKQKQFLAGRQKHSINPCSCTAQECQGTVV